METKLRKLKLFKMTIFNLKDFMKENILKHDTTRGSEVKVFVTIYSSQRFKNEDQQMIHKNW